MSNPESLFGHFWGRPLLIGSSTAFGLVCALLADGLYDFAGTVCIAVPGLISLWLIGKFALSRSPAPER